MIHLHGLTQHVCCPRCHGERHIFQRGNTARVPCPICGGLGEVLEEFRPVLAARLSAGTWHDMLAGLLDEAAEAHRCQAEAALADDLAAARHWEQRRLLLLEFACAIEQRLAALPLKKPARRYSARLAYRTAV